MLHTKIPAFVQNSWGCQVDSLKTLTNLQGWKPLIPKSNKVRREPWPKIFRILLSSLQWHVPNFSWPPSNFPCGFKGFWSSNAANGRHFLQIVCQVLHSYCMQWRDLSPPCSLRTASKNRHASPSEAEKLRRCFWREEDRFWPIRALMQSWFRARITYRCTLLLVTSFPHPTCKKMVWKSSGIALWWGRRARAKGPNFQARLDFTTGRSQNHPELSLIKCLPCRKLSENPPWS